MQNGCKISLMNPQQSSALWEAQAEASGKGERWVAALLSWDWWCLPKGESRCSGARTPSDPAHTGVPVSYVLLACSSPDQQLLWRTACACECVCVRGRERERERQGEDLWAGPCQQVQSQQGEKPYHPQVQYNARIQESNLRFLISLPRLFQPACPVYSRIK